MSMINQGEIISSDHGYKAMITRLRVKNYLSLKDVDVALGQRNILVGPNMAGKSNLIDCFKFLAHMVSSGISRAFLERGGFSEVVWKGNADSRISFALSAETGGKANKHYEYELSIVGSATGLISVEKEHLVVKTGAQVSSLIDLQYGQGQITHLDGSQAFRPPGPGQSALEFAVPGWEGTEVREFIASWRFYRFLPTLMKQANAAVGQNFLNEHGDNFSSWLMTLQTGYPEEFRQFRQAAIDALPDLEAVLTPPTQLATTYVTTREKHLKQPVTIWRMSDGELVFLAFLSLIFAPEAFSAPLYCIEEPENHLHPRLLETLAELLTQRQQELGAQAAQIIATTHSPYLIDHLTLDDLIVLEKRNGATQCTRPASTRHLKDLLEREELGLGALWYAGSLGGEICEPSG
jgi:predicted ATPase